LEQCVETEYYNYNISACEACTLDIDNCGVGAYEGCGGTDKDRYCTSCEAGFVSQGNKCVAEALQCKENGIDQFGQVCGTCVSGRWSNNGTCCECCNIDVVEECCSDAISACCPRDFDTSLCPSVPVPPEVPDVIETRGSEITESCSPNTLKFINGTACCPASLTAEQCARARGNRTFTPETDNSVGKMDVSWESSQKFVAAFATALYVAIAVGGVVIVGAVGVLYCAHRMSMKNDQIKWKEFFAERKK